MPREYWINVYDDNVIFNWHETREKAIKAVSAYWKLAYRLHVKLKDNYKCQ